MPSSQKCLKRHLSVFSQHWECFFSPRVSLHNCQAIACVEHEPSRENRTVSVPVWMLLGFAAWTVLLLIATVGTYRWGRILTGTAHIASFRADQIEGAGWYQRGTRAHANCIENLPVFAAIVLALQAGSVGGTLVN